MDKDSTINFFTHTQNLWICYADYSGNNHVPPSRRLGSAPLPSSHRRAKPPRRQPGHLTPRIEDSIIHGDLAHSKYSLQSPLAQHTQQRPAYLLCKKYIAEMSLYFEKPEM